MLRVFWTASKTFLKKRVSRFHNNYAFVNVGNLHTRKTFRVWISTQENQMSHVFWTFLLLTEEDMASYSRDFRKPRSAEEDRNLIENAIPNSTRAVWQNGEWKVFWNARMVGKTKIPQSNRALRLHNWQVWSATLGHWYSQQDGWVTELLTDKIFSINFVQK